jgi:uncharacterized protein YidB (DUF937 family)
MSSLEDLLGSLTGGQTQTGAAPQAGGGGTGSLLATLAPTIASMLAGGGLQKILQQLQAKGRSNKASSWVSTGENQPLSADEVKEVVGEDQVRAAAAQAGVSEDEAAGGLAELLPQIVDKASPDGQLIDEKSLDDALGKLASAAR